MPICTQESLLFFTCSIFFVFPSLPPQSTLHFHLLIQSKSRILYISSNPIPLPFLALITPRSPFIPEAVHRIPLTTTLPCTLLQGKQRPTVKSVMRNALLMDKSEATRKLIRPMILRDPFFPRRTVLSYPTRICRQATSPSQRQYSNLSRFISNVCGTRKR